MLHAPLPLSLRVPNPPPLFVGRERERESLRVAFTRGPVTLVHGDHGIGKTATVLQVLRESFVDLPVAFVELGGLPEDVAPDRELVRALAATASVTQIAWSSVLRVRDNLPEVLLDMAEHARLWLVLDGVTADPMLRDLMAVVSQYARHSRWIVTGEGFCQSKFLPGQSVRLGPLPQERMEELAQRSAPDSPSWREAASAAAGNPGALLQAITPVLEPSSSIQDATLSAMRALADRNAEAVRAWLDLHAEAAIRDGYARNLYTMLSLRRHESALARWWVRCAAEVGDVDALPDQALAETTLTDATAILGARFSGGDLARSLRDARALAARALTEGVARVAGEARTIEARCLAMQGDLSGALATVDSIESDDDELVCMRDGSASTILALLHQREAAHTRLEELRNRVRNLPFSAQNPLLYRAADTLYQLGYLHEAHDVITQIMTADRGRSLSFHHTGLALFLRTCIATDRGALAEAAELQERIRPFAREGTLLYPFAAPNQAYRRLWVGDLAGLPALTAAALQTAHDRGYREAQCWAALAAIEIALANGSGLEEILREPLVLQARTDAAASPLLRETIRRAELHAGRPAPAEALTNRSVEHEIVGHLADAEAHVLAGAWQEALDACRAAVQHAARWGYAPREAQARSLLTGLLYAEARAEEAAQQARALRDLAERIESPRFLHEAELWAHLATPSVAPLQLLEHAAREESPSPFVARCARRLLGGPAGSDVIEEKLFARLAPRIGPFERLGNGQVPSWGLVDAGRWVYSNDGRRISLEAKPLLWRMLVTLWDRSGELEKEELVRAVWEQDDYHPLRDDNRLHVSIRKLRTAIDTQPPVRLITSTNGYALGGTLIRLRRASGETPVRADQRR